jgi:hypothetical protein
MEESKKKEYVSASEKRAVKEEERARRRMIKRTRVWGIWIVVLIVFIALMFWGIRAAKDAEQVRLGTSYDIVGREHIEDGLIVDSYNSNPPTSGPHYGAPAPWGVYQVQIPDETLVHNLEHGGIWISYNASVDANLITELEKFAQQFPGSVILTPRPENVSAVTLAAWGVIFEMNEFDEELTKQFMRENINKAPEPLAESGSHI